MFDDEEYVSSELYRLGPRRKRPGSELGEALDANRDTGSIWEALDLATGKIPEPDPAEDFSWTASGSTRHWHRRLGQALVRRDNWTFAAVLVGAVAAVAGVVIAYLTLVKPSG